MSLTIKNFYLLPTLMYLHNYYYFFQNSLVWDWKKQYISVKKKIGSQLAATIHSVRKEVILKSEIGEISVVSKTRKAISMKN